MKNNIMKSSGLFIIIFIIHCLDNKKISKGGITIRPKNDKQIKMIEELKKKELEKKNDNNTNTIFYYFLVILFIFLFVYFIVPLVYFFIAQPHAMIGKERVLERRHN